jgi:hypothetical protein
VAHKRGVRCKPEGGGRERGEASIPAPLLAGCMT